MGTVQPTLLVTAAQETLIATGKLVRDGHFLRSVDTGRFVAKLPEVNPTALQKAGSAIKSLGPLAVNVAKSHPVGSTVVLSVAAVATVGGTVHARNQVKLKDEQEKAFKNLSTSFDDWLAAVKNRRVTRDHVNAFETRYKQFISKYPKLSEDIQQQLKRMCSTMEVLIQQMNPSTDNLPAPVSRPKDLADVIDLQKRLLGESA